MIYNRWVLWDIIRPFLDTGYFMGCWGVFFCPFFVRRAFSLNSEVFIDHVPCGSFVLVGDVGNNNEFREIVCYVRK